MVKLNFEALTPGMKARLDAPHRMHSHRSAADKRTVTSKLKRGSINCMLADAVRMPFNRTQA
jgi:hypothetical protein